MENVSAAGFVLVHMLNVFEALVLAEVHDHIGAPHDHGAFSGLDNEDRRVLICKRNFEIKIV